MILTSVGIVECFLSNRYGVDEDDDTNSDFSMVLIQFNIRLAKKCYELASINRLIISFLITLVVASVSIEGYAQGELPGDANGDGQINILDVTATLNDILGTAQAPGNADCNIDGAVNILDVTCDLNVILGKSPTPTPPAGANGKGAIQGMVTSSNGIPLNAIHVRAVNVSNTDIQISSFSGIGDNLTFDDGVFYIGGVPPGDYRVLIERLDGRSSGFDSERYSAFVATNSPGISFPDEYYNGAGESSTDNPTEFVVVTVTGGQTTQGINFITNDGGGVPPPGVNPNIPPLNEDISDLLVVFDHPAGLIGLTSDGNIAAVAFVFFDPTVPSLVMLGPVISALNFSITEAIIDTDLDGDLTDELLLPASGSGSIEDDSFLVITNLVIIDVEFPDIIGEFREVVPLKEEILAGINRIINFERSESIDVNEKDLYYHDTLLKGALNQIKESKIESTLGK